MNPQVSAKVSGLLRRIEQFEKATHIADVVKSALIRGVQAEIDALVQQGVLDLGTPGASTEAPAGAGAPAAPSPKAK